MKRLLVTAAGALAVGCALATPAYADPVVQHLAFSFDETASSPMDSLGRGCPDFSGTVLEQRHDELAGIMQADGTVHGRTTATSSVRLVPDDPAETSYTGGYTLRQSGTFGSAGTEDRVVTSVAHGRLTGSDGSALGFTEVVHFSVAHDGTVRASFDRPHCS